MARVQDIQTSDANFKAIEFVNQQNMFAIC